MFNPSFLNHFKIKIRNLLLFRCFALTSINSILRIQCWVRGRKITCRVTRISPYYSVKLIPASDGAHWNAPFFTVCSSPTICRILWEGDSSWTDRYYHLVSPPPPLPLSSNLFVASTVCNLGHTMLLFASNNWYAAATSHLVFSQGDRGFRGLEFENRKKKYC